MFPLVARNDEKGIMTESLKGEGVKENFHGTQR